MISRLALPQRAHAAALILLVSVLSPISADAQYFGRNKVQYETFRFEVMKSPHFDVHFYNEELEPTKDASRMLERWYVRLSTLLGHQFSRKPVILYANHADFQQTNVIGGEISEGTGGVTESLRTRVILPFTGVYADNDHVLGHELVHAFQYDIAARDSGTDIASMEQLPLWAIEGMAEYLSLGRTDPHTAMWLRDALRRRDLPTMTQLSTDPRYFPYRYGQSVWAFIGGEFGDDKVTRIYRAALREGWEPALLRVLGLKADSLSARWHRSITDTYGPLMAGRTAPDSVGRRVVFQKEDAMNVSPAVSPDGRHVAFISRRSLFSIDLYLADAQTGEIIKTLATPQSGTHFDDISFISSSGAWSPDGKKFAFIVFADGDNEISILDVASRDIERQIKVPGVGGVLSLAWSPDGRQIAFSGTAGGVSDLYLVDSEGETVRRLTNDRYADLHPTWAPDGRTIAFATDRGPGTNLDRLSFAPLRLALVDVGTGTIREVPIFDGAKHINPQFAPDGRSLYFIADPDGFSDIYRVELESGQVYRVTNVATGISGITHLSPAMSVARSTGRVMFSVFHNAGNNIHSLEAAEARGVEVPAGAARPNAGLLPPVAAVGPVSTYLADATTGLPATRDFPITPYRSALKLDYIGQPSLGVGVSSYGAMVGGAVSFFFGDMLGNRNLGVALQANGTLKDVGGEVFYLNTQRRWNWLVSGGHYPTLSGFATVAPVLVDVEGSPVEALEINQILQRTTFDQATMLVQYPFSKTRRVELGASATYVSYDREVRRLVQVGNSIFDDGARDTIAPPSVGFGEATAAYVGDNSFFGFTSPIQGGRHRFEISPTFGGINFVGALADARKYFFVKPFTLAVRGLHVGRYGGQSDDDRLTPLYLGYPSLVRGYDANSFEARECTGAATAGDQCPQFDRLLGTRIGVANAELRIPLFGSEQLGIIKWGLMPIEIAPFFDAGVAWTGSESADLRFDRNTSDRVPVMSTGITARTNLFGFAVLEVFWVRPYQRPEKGNFFGFQLAPGW